MTCPQCDRAGKIKVEEEEIREFECSYCPCYSIECVAEED